jgi:hypothetical protein
MPWLVGDKIRMFFSCAGTVSEELLRIIEINNLTVTLDDFGTDDEGNDGYRIFDRKTGKCLNDNTMFDCKRYIKRF